MAEIRQSVKDLYPNYGWGKQVDKMANEHVIAIYLANVPEILVLDQKEQPPEQGRLF